MTQNKKRKFSRIKKIALFILTLFTLFVSLIAFNGLVLAANETPLLFLTNHPAKKIDSREATIKILSYNIAKCFITKRFRFVGPEKVRARLEKIARVIREEEPDLVFISEAIVECAPCPVNQVEYLAQATGMHSFAFGENYNLGLPFYRIVGGNAILSRFPMKVVANPSLVGRKPFFITRNNRRVLWAEFEIQGERILLASIHNDSFQIENNHKQLQQILGFLGERKAILAGDFNSRPEQAPIQWLKGQEKFSGNFRGDFTFSSEDPDKKIDYIFAPNSWELIETRVISNHASDHFPLVATFSLKK